MQRWYGDKIENKPAGFGRQKRSFVNLSQAVLRRYMVEVELQTIPLATLKILLKSTTPIYNRILSPATIKAK